MKVFEGMDSLGGFFVVYPLGILPSGTLKVSRVVGQFSVYSFTFTYHYQGGVLFL